MSLRRCSLMVVGLVVACLVGGSICAFAEDPKPVVTDWQYAYVTQNPNLGETIPGLLHKDNNLLLWPDGRVISSDPEPWEEGRAVAVHVLVSTADMQLYAVRITGKAYDYGVPAVAGSPHATLRLGSFDWSKADTSRWLTFRTPQALSGDEPVKIKVSFKEKDLVPDISMQLDKLYQFSLSVGVASTGLGRHVITRAQGPPVGSPPTRSTVLAVRDAGRGTEMVATLIAYPHKRPVYRRPRNTLDNFSLILGTRLDKPLTTWMAGVGVDIIPGITLMGGWTGGSVEVLAPGYSLGDSVPATGNLPTVGHAETGSFFGITFGTALWDKLWKK